MPKLGRPNSKEKRLYFLNGQSEVQRKAPFGTNYTPTFVTKIVGSRYRKIEDDFLMSPRKTLSPLSNQDDNNKSINSRPILPPIISEREKNYNLSELIALLPPGKELPNKPISLRNFEQISLINITKHEILNIPDFVNNLKRIYLMLAKIDINLTGLCSFKEFVDACYHNNVHLSLNLFRVISSLFVVSNRDDVKFVHYEKIISFLGAIQNSFQDEQNSRSPTRNHSPYKETARETSDHPLYFHDDDCIDNRKNEKNYDSVIPIDDAELIRIINEDIGFYPIPIQRIRLTCQRNDSFHRGTLSAKQLEDICFSEGLNLKYSTFCRILQRCKFMGGGQYNWQNFVDFLEKLQPINTGLHIPSSKMPLDFVKHIPEPASSWPHAEPSEMHHDMRESQMYSHIQNLENNYQKDFSQQHSPVPENIVSPNYFNYNSSRTPIAKPVQNADQITQVAQQEPWFNKFLKFVDLVYVKDINSKGFLPTKELFEIATILNQQLGLDFTTTEIISALDGASVDHDNHYSNINSFLKRLSVRSTK